jgi:KRAB domain-containing zinc finger protein
MVYLSRILDQKQPPKKPRALPQFKCQHCDKLFKTASFLAAHLRKCHSRKKPDSKGQKFRQKIDLTSHDVQAGEQQHDNLTKKTCEVCGKEFARRKTLYSHMLTHKPDKWKFNCSKCKQTFMTSRLMATHSAKEHSEALICQQCGKGYSSDTNLRAHMINIHNDEKLTCELCGKVFTSKAYLKVILTDSGEPQRLGGERQRL